MAYGASIDRPQAVNRPSTSKITKSHSKRVRFGSTNVIADVKLCQDPSEKDNLWWSTDRLRETHQAARDLGLEALRSCWMVKGFEEMFEAAQRAALRLADADEASIHESFQTMAVSGEVVDWCRYGHSWRGLERSSSIRNNEARSDVIKSAKRAVLENSEFDPEAIRLAYERESLSAKIFARAMGVADAHAVVQGREHFLRKRRLSASKSPLTLP